METAKTIDFLGAYSHAKAKRVHRLQVGFVSSHFTRLFLYIWSDYRKGELETPQPSRMTYLQIMHPLLDLVRPRFMLPVRSASMIEADYKGPETVIKGHQNHGHRGEMDQGLHKENGTPEILVQANQISRTFTLVDLTCAKQAVI